MQKGKKMDFEIYIIPRLDELYGVVADGLMVTLP